VEKVNIIHIKKKKKGRMESDQPAKGGDEEKKVE